MAVLPLLSFPAEIFPELRAIYRFSVTRPTSCTSAKRLRINQLTLKFENDTLRCPLPGKMPNHVAFVALTTALCVSVACSSGRGRVAVATPPPPTPTVVVQPPPAPAVDPIQELLAAADRQFEEGRKELTLGHLAKAKTHFNQALGILLAIAVLAEPFLHATQRSASDGHGYRAAGASAEAYRFSSGVLIRIVATLLLSGSLVLALLCALWLGATLWPRRRFQAEAAA